MARNRAVSAGELLIDSEDSSEMAIRSNLSRLEKRRDSFFGAKDREVSMVSAVTLLCI